jgi:hypothetical protein
MLHVSMVGRVADFLRGRRRRTAALLLGNLAFRLFRRRGEEARAPGRNIAGWTNTDIRHVETIHRSIKIGERVGLLIRSRLGPGDVFIVVDNSLCDSSDDPSAVFSGTGFLPSFRENHRRGRRRWGSLASLIKSLQEFLSILLFFLEGVLVEFIPLVNTSSPCARRSDWAGASNGVQGVK